MLKLSDSLLSVKGIGEKKANSLKDIGVSNVNDLLDYFPRKYIDRRDIRSIAHLEINEENSFIARVVRVNEISRGKRRLIVTALDESGKIDLIFFNRSFFFRKMFKIGQIYFFAGKVSFFRGKQIIHPEYSLISEDSSLERLAAIIPIYPWSNELEKSYWSQLKLRNIIHDMIKKDSVEIHETLTDDLKAQYGLMDLGMAYEKIHFPEEMDDVMEAKKRFVFEEAFYLSLLMGIRRMKNKKTRGICFRPSRGLLRKFVDSLSFKLTKAQTRVINDIYGDMTSSCRMNRLLQGDVGSGKTVVAIIAMLLACENGYQAILMAPTEILAEQHFMDINDLLRDWSIQVLLLKGSLTKKQKEKALKRIESNEVKIIIGTHALIQENVAFKNPGIVVIDEQHRFGVEQRSKLQETGAEILIMSATPIPRSLAMTLYGDMEYSVIDELPPGRKPIVTRHFTLEQTDLVYQEVGKRIQNGNQAYFVYPLIEESRKSDLKAAEKAFVDLKIFFRNYNVALIHGRMKNSEKNEIMEKFVNNEIQILASTTVIEVGVNVPNSNTMVIEHAERFGLSQLHQLRGRVGRGADQAYCYLLTKKEMTDETRARVDVMTRSNDGFEIANEDLKIRGPGNLLGTKQSGLPPIRFLEIFQNPRILRTTKKTAADLLRDDEQLLKFKNSVFRKNLLKKYKNNLDFLDIG